MGRPRCRPVFSPVYVAYTPVLSRGQCRTEWQRRNPPHTRDATGRQRIGTHHATHDHIHIHIHTHTHTLHCTRTDLCLQTPKCHAMPELPNLPERLSRPRCRAGQARSWRTPSAGSRYCSTASCRACRTRRRTESHPCFPQLLAPSRLPAGLLQGCFGSCRASARGAADTG